MTVKMVFQYRYTYSTPKCLSKPHCRILTIHRMLRAASEQYMHPRSTS